MKRDSDECVPVMVSQILWTSAKRCAYHPNPKRPTWRCKAAPVWMVLYEEQRKGGSVPGLYVCDEHKATLLETCP